MLQHRLRKFQLALCDLYDFLNKSCADFILYLGYPKRSASKAWRVFGNTYWSAVRGGSGSIVTVFSSDPGRFMPSTF